MPLPVQASALCIRWISSASCGRMHAGSVRPCAVKRHNPAGWETRHNQTMKEIDNRSETASPRGGVESSVVGTRSTATKVNTTRLWTWTSLRASGEVATVEQSKVSAHGSSHGSPCATSSVVGGSRSGRGCEREDGRPAGEPASQWRTPNCVTAIPPTFEVCPGDRHGSRSR
jgi:hypothetical protein